MPILDDVFVHGRYALGRRRPSTLPVLAVAEAPVTRHFLRALENLGRDVLHMGGAVESAVGRAVRALLDRDVSEARAVIEGDREVNLLELKIDEECLKMLALYQPAARDLRFVTGVMKIINDQERVGDLAVNVAERARAIADLPPRDAPPAFVEMADRVRAMLTAALDALVRQDPKRAIEVLKMDERVDALLKDVYERTQSEMLGDSEHVSFGLQLLAASKNLERIADHASNIAEDVVYIVDGTILRHRG
jgi:phosphate transport system protein